MSKSVENEVSYPCTVVLFSKAGEAKRVPGTIIGRSRSGKLYVSINPLVTARKKCRRFSLHSNGKFQSRLAMLEDVPAAFQPETVIADAAASAKPLIATVRVYWIVAHWSHGKELIESAPTEAQLLPKLEQYRQHGLNGDRPIHGFHIESRDHTGTVVPRPGQVPLRNVELFRDSQKLRRLG